MATLLDLAAKLSLDSSEYEKGIDKAESKASKFGDAMKTAGKVAAGAFAAIGTATVAGTAALIKNATEVSNYGDNIDKMSQKLGLSAEAFQEWDAILQYNGADISSMTGAMRTLNKAVTSGSEAFGKLGISEKDVANLNQEDLFAKVITGLQGMEEGTERTALATELLGRGAVELTPLLNTSAEETEELRKHVHELNGVMSNEAVSAAASYNDAMQDLTTSWGGLKRNLVSDFMPSMTTVMQGLSMIFSSDRGGGIDLIDTGIEMLVTNISEKIPEVLDIGTKIVSALLSAITFNLPTLLSAGAEALISIVTGITKQLPTILKAAIEVIKTLATGLTKNFSQLIPTLIDVVFQITEVLIDNVDVLVEAAIEIITTLMNGIIDALPMLLNKMPELIKKVLEALITAMPMIIEAGIGLISTLITGIVDAIPTLVQFIPTIIVTILTTLIENLPLLIESGIKMIPQIIAGIIQAIPSLVAAIPQIIVAVLGALIQGAKSLLTAGKEMVEKVKEGFKQKIEDAKQWGKDLIQNFKDGITAKWEALKNGVRNIANGIKNLLGFSEPKEGPLSNFHTYAPDMMKLFAKGIKDNEDVVYDQLRKSFDLDDFMSMNATATGQADMYGAESKKEERPIKIVVQSVLDGRIIGENTYDYISGRIRAGELAWT